MLAPTGRDPVTNQGDHCGAVRPTPGSRGARPRRGHVRGAVRDLRHARITDLSLTPTHRAEGRDELRRIARSWPLSQVRGRHCRPG